MKKHNKFKELKGVHYGWAWNVQIGRVTGVEAGMEARIKS